MEDEDEKRAAIISGIIVLNYKMSDIHVGFSTDTESNTIAALKVDIEGKYSNDCRNDHVSTIG